MGNKVESCDNCYYFGDELVVDVCIATVCRRHGPVFVMRGEVTQSRAWPNVEASDWCGDFKPKRKVLAYALGAGNNQTRTDADVQVESIRAGEIRASVLELNNDEINDLYDFIKEQVEGTGGGNGQR